jgi:hypothetical protein
VNVQVGKLTVRGSRRDAGFRVRAESRLRSLDLHPSGLPGHAILIVRRLELPAVDHSSAQRARADLDRLSQAAARPAAGPVAASAPVVLFRDEVELLACLTSDLARGVAGQRWYWRQIGPVQPTRPAGPGPALAAAWLRYVRWLPGSLARLPEPEVRKAVSLLFPPEAAKVLRALLSAFGVADQPTPPRPRLTRPPPGPPGPPWRRWLPPTSLPAEAEALWGVALSLHHAPSVVRGPGYASELAAWQEVTGQATRLWSPTRGDPADDPAERPPAGPDPVPAGLQSGAPAEGALSPGATGRGTTSAAAYGGIVTGLASLLFLVNFVVWLDDRADPPWPAGWALVELLGRYLLGDRLTDVADDPLWEVLAELDGRRAGTAAAVGLGPGDPLRLPRAWLERWPPASPGYVARRHGERLVIRHPRAGFVAADVPCPAGAFEQQCAAEAGWLGDVGVAAGDLATDGLAEPENPSPGRRFDQAVGAFVRWLLRSRGIAAPALATPGRVLVTGTHVDVVLGLQDIDLAVRVAGLDRDPGWVPALSRIVLFHFLDAP